MNQRLKAMNRIIGSDGEKFLISFPYSFDVKEALKQATNSRRYVSPDEGGPYWTVALEEADALKNFAQQYDFRLTDPAQELLNQASPVELPFGELRVAKDGSSAEFWFPFKPAEAILKEIRDIQGRKYNITTRIWSAPINAATITQIKAFIIRNNVKVIGGDKIDVALRNILDNIEGSKAIDADIEIPRFGTEFLKPRAFQKAGIAYALKNLSPGKGVYIADEMGLGKSLTSLGILESRMAFPALVTVPKKVWLQWAEEVRKWIPHRRVVLLTGKNVPKSTLSVGQSLGAQVVGLTEPLPEADIFVVGHEILTKWVDPVTNSETDNVEMLGRLREIQFKGVVFDEAHAFKERKAKRTEAAKLLAHKEVEVILALSGTPTPNRPAELITVIKDLLHRLDEVGGWPILWFRYCEGWGGGAAHLDEFNERMRSAFYVRRTKKEVMPELPPIEYVTVAVEMENPDRYYDIQNDIALWIHEKLQKEFPDMDPALLLEEANTIADEQADTQAEILVRMNALRQVAAQEKLGATIAWVEQFLEDSGDDQIILFSIHREINEKLAEHFKAPIIYGGMKDADRFNAQKQFQEGKVRVLIASIGAAGVGLNLTAASHIAFVEHPWRPMDYDQAIARAYGRLSDAHGVTCYLIRVPKTIEDAIVKLVAHKRVVTDATQDGSQSLMMQILRKTLGDG